MTNPLQDSAISPELEAAIADFRRAAEQSADAYERGHGYQPASDAELLAAIRASHAAVRQATIEECAKECELEAERWEGADGPIATEARLCAIRLRALRGTGEPT